MRQLSPDERRELGSFMATLDPSPGDPAPPTDDQDYLLDTSWAAADEEMGPPPSAHGADVDAVLAPAASRDVDALLAPGEREDLDALMDSFLPGQGPGGDAVGTSPEGVAPAASPGGADLFDSAALDLDVGPAASAAATPTVEEPDFDPFAGAQDPPPTPVPDRPLDLFADVGDPDPATLYAAEDEDFPEGDPPVAPMAGQPAADPDPPAPSEASDGLDALFAEAEPAPVEAAPPGGMQALDDLLGEAPSGGPQPGMSVPGAPPSAPPAASEDEDPFAAPPPDGLPGPDPEGPVAADPFPGFDVPDEPAHPEVGPASADDPPFAAPSPAGVPGAAADAFEGSEDFDPLAAFGARGEDLAPAAAAGEADPFAGEAAAEAEVPASAPPAGADPMATDALVEQDPFAAAPAEVDPFAAPAEADPFPVAAEADPFAGAPASDDPFASAAEADPFSAAPAEVDPFAAAPPEVDPFAAAPAEPDPVAAAPAEVDPFAAAPAEPDPSEGASVAFDPLAAAGPGPEVSASEPGADFDPLGEVSAPAEEGAPVDAMGASTDFDPLAGVAVAPEAAPGAPGAEPFAAAAPHADPFAAAAPHADPFAAASPGADPFAGLSEPPGPAPSPEPAISMDPASPFEGLPAGGAEPAADPLATLLGSQAPPRPVPGMEVASAPPAAPAPTPAPAPASASLGDDLGALARGPSRERTDQEESVRTTIHVPSQVQAHQPEPDQAPAPAPEGAGGWERRFHGLFAPLRTQSQAMGDPEIMATITKSLEEVRGEA